MLRGALPGPAPGLPSVGSVRAVRLADIDYELDPGLIAQHPIEPRDAARLLVDRGSAMPDDVHVRDLPELLRDGDVLVVNDSRVIPARLRLRRETGGAVEVLLLEPLSGDWTTWEALVRPGGRLRVGEALYDDSGAGLATMGERRPAGDTFAVTLTFAGGGGTGGAGEGGGGTGRVAGGAAGGADGRGAGSAGVEASDEGPAGGPGRSKRTSAPRWSPPSTASTASMDGPGAVDRVAAALAEVGQMPLPPYITAPLADADRYQTVYAEHPGSAAAPTAGLHLTEELLLRIEARGVPLLRVDLAVGLDTFAPVTVDDPLQHPMHTERYAVSAETWAAIESAKRVVAVGTTTVRTLESVRRSGALAGRTDILLHPGNPVQVADVVMTNFHLPRTTLLLLVEAITGTRWRRLYQHAIEQRYRFLSFGDATLLDRHAE